MERDRIKRKDSQGQILAEFAISLGILSIGIVSCLVCINKGLHITNQATALQAGTYLAMEEMELVKNIPFPYPDDPTDTDQFNNIADRSLSAVNRCGYVFDLQRTVTNTADSAGNEIKKEVQIDVYKSGSTQPLVTYKTYFSKDGL